MYSETRLWRKAFVEERTDASSREQSFFLHALEAVRSNTKELVARITVDMPWYTQHEISHLDALWETADVAAGTAVSLNPAEGFVLGSAILLHDGGMTLAAYPGGLAELKQTVQWRDTAALLAREPDEDESVSLTTELEQKIKTEVLRRLHAQKARELATQGWKLTPTGEDRVYLIEDRELRRFYGLTIGEIAHSHWWGIDRIDDELDRTLGPMVPITTGSVDVLKLACLLRVADSIHLDRRRAPTFVRALVAPEGDSASHWIFQEKLAFPILSGSSLAFTAGEAFSKNEADAWWIGYDALSTADRELHDVDRLLRAHKRPRLAARSIKGANDPDELTEYLKTDGWKPVETRISVSDVPAIVQTLGGARLYGADQLAPIRELLQNARDAVEARRRLQQNRPANWGKITVELVDRGDVWLCVEDSGVGMSQAVLTETLLDFGKSLWRSERVQQEFPGLAASGMKSVGRFGIGFFSVFMLGDQVRVITRRFDRGSEDSFLLEFDKGLRSRPILSRTQDSVPVDGGTRVEVKLAQDPKRKNGISFSSAEKEGSPLSSVIAFVAPALDVSVQTSEFAQISRSIEAEDWLSADPEILSERLIPSSLLHRSSVPKLRGNLSEVRLKDGPVYGRAAIVPTQYFNASGVVTVGGLRASTVNWAFGILKGRTKTAARKEAELLVPPEVLQFWASAQAKLLANSRLEPEEKVDCAKTILTCGGDVGALPLARFNGKWLNHKEIKKLLRATSKVVVHIGNIEFEEDWDYIPKLAWDPSFEPYPHIMVLPGGPLSSAEILDDLVFSLAAAAWGEVEIDEDDEYEVGVVAGEKIIRSVEIWRRANADNIEAPV